jgi:hypothetical protein
MNAKYLIIMLTALLLWSCEEDVRLDLGEIEKRLVVEARISNENPTVTVSLSYSQNFYDLPKYERLTNATVVVESESGQSETLTLNNEHIYTSSSLKPEYGEKYTLRIKVDDYDFTTEAFLPPPMQITNTVFVPNPFFNTPDSLNIFVNVADRVGEDNYFRLKVNKLGTTPTDEYYVVDDTFGKDGLISMPIYFKNFTKGDTVIVELYHLNASIYQYYGGLTENLRGSFNSIAPGNPVSNMPDEVYGYFAGYSTDIDTIIVGAMPVFMPQTKQ